MKDSKAPPQSCNQQRRATVFTLMHAALELTLWNMTNVADAHALVGPVRPPLSLPPIKVIRHDGSSASLPELLQGKVTALQFMFTGCSQTCPLQGALFAAVQQKLPRNLESSVQFISISIDSLGDDPPALSAWLRQFGAAPNWIAAVPSAGDLERLRAALQQKSNDARDNHTGQVFLMNRQGLLVWATEDLPPVEVVSRQLINVART